MARKKVEPSSHPGEEYAFAVKPKKIPTSDDRIKVLVNSHPLIRHWVAVLRNKDTDTDDFKNAMAELGRLLFYEASRNWLPTVPVNLRSPMGAAASGEIIDPKKPIVIVIILRAGLALAEHAAWGLISKHTYHLGISREKGKHQGTVYLNELPKKFPEGFRVFLVDPMVASGITLVEALRLINERGVDNKNIKVISAIVARPTFLKLLTQFPGLDIYAGDLDEGVNNNGFIFPGLGDDGLRSFGI